MIDHLKIRVKDFAKAKEFYDQVLATLGMKALSGSLEELKCGYGTADRPFFKITQSTKDHPVSRVVHLAFKAKDQKMVKDFYEAAIKAGGKDSDWLKGAPAPRPHYSPTYYAAYIFDLDGNNIEACLY